MGKERDDHRGHKKKKSSEEERHRKKRNRHMRCLTSSSGSSRDGVSEEDVIRNRGREKDLRGRKHKSKKKHRSENHKGERDRVGSKKKPRERVSSPLDEEDEESSSDDSSSSAKSAEVAANAQDLAAAILARFPDVACDLQQLLHIVDCGQVLDISSLPDKKLVLLLQKLFRALKLREVGDKVYALPKGGRLTSELLGPFWKNYLHKDRMKDLHDQKLLERPEEAKMSMETEERQAAETNKDKINLQGSEEGEVERIGPIEKPINFAVNPLLVNRSRFVGPAAPSKEQLAAAARLSAAESVLREAEDELEQDPFIGPPPPAAVAEAESANEAERFEEVARILSLESGNPYDLLGAKPESTVEVIKKRYWKVSLLVHPDKCAHPQAQQAFTAVNRAFKDIEDPVKRAEIDRKLLEKQRQEEYEEELRSLQEAAHWRRLRGEPLEGDDDLLGGGTKAPARDEWMTELPPERKAGGAPSMHSTFFSKAGREGRGDTSAWTDTPLQKAEKAKMQYLEAYKQAALTAAEDAKLNVETQKTTKIAELVDQYNEKKRPHSLLEEHKLKTAGKSQKVLQKAPEKEPDWAGKHPWKPWDREKDLMAGRKPISLDAKAMGQGLSSRFASSGSERKFL